MDTPESSENSAEFIRLLTTHQSALRGLVAALLPGSQDIDDVLQDANVILWEKRDKYDWDASFRSWAYGVARNKVRQHWRKQKKETCVTLSEEFHDAEAEACQSETPDDFQQKRAALDLCLNNLKPRDRELIDACYEAREGVDTRVVQFGLTAASLRVTTHRIRKKLRICVEKRLTWKGECA